MKTIICTIAKNEDKYIKDFCEYHLSIGFDEIHIFDNGTDIPFSDSRIIVHPFRDVNTRCPQMKAYRECIKNESYDWCAFIDVDEFITIKNNNIVNFLSTIDSSVDGIRLNERLYGDNDEIVPANIDIPVYERITKIARKSPIRSYKYILRHNQNLLISSPHDVVIKETRQQPNFVTNFNECYIRHYKTKTLSEFCDQKLNTPRVFNQFENRTIDYFFRVNKRTPEKIAYLKSRGIEVK